MPLELLSRSGCRSFDADGHFLARLPIGRVRHESREDHRNQSGLAACGILDDWTGIGSNCSATRQKRQANTTHNLTEGEAHALSVKLDHISGKQRNEGRLTVWRDGMDLFVFQRTASGQPWQQLNVILGPDELLGSNGAGELGSIPKSNFILSSSVGQLGGVCPLDGGGKVPVEFLPDKAVEVTITVASEAARFALTTAAVQSGDRVKQSDNGSVWTLIDEANIANADGWVKTGLVDWTDIQNKPSSFDVEELNLGTLANTSLTTVTITKKVTIINAEVGTSSAHLATIRFQGGSGGEVVYVNKATYSGGSLRGALQIQSQTGAGVWNAVTTLNNTSGYFHQRCVLQRIHAMPMRPSRRELLNQEHQRGRRVRHCERQRRLSMLKRVEWFAGVH